MRKNQKKIFKQNQIRESTIQESAFKPATLREATGKIDYTLTNDYMFRAVLQENENVLRRLICSLLRLKAKDIKSVTILNPIELGKVYGDKDFVLDVKVMLNDEKIINLEIQVMEQEFWSNRSLSYLCAIFNNLKKGMDYSEVKPAYHIGILDFTPFPDYPEFYATNKIINVKKNYIYNDNFTLNVLDLKQIHLATEEDKAYRLDYWAKLFKISVWEEIKMLTQEENVFEELGKTLFELNQKEEIRYICEMREEGRRITRTYTNQIARLEKADRANKKALAKKDAALAKKDSDISKMSSEIAALKAQLEALQHRNGDYNA